MAQASLLVVDDDRDFAAMLGQSLAAEDFAVTHAAGGLEALQTLAAQGFDLLILDIMMPGLSGLELLRRIRRERDTPVLMLTARGDELDRVVGLELGADDYLAKPFHPRELVARIRAILRRTGRTAPAPGPPVSVGPLTLDPTSLTVAVDGRPARLTVAEFLVLEALARAAGAMLSRAALSEQALGRPLEAYDRAINTHVSNIRRKLGLGPGLGLEIRSVRSLGYRLVTDGGA